MCRQGCHSAILIDCVKAIKRGIKVGWSLGRNLNPSPSEKMRRLRVKEHGCKLPVVKPNILVVSETAPLCTKSHSLKRLGRDLVLWLCWHRLKYNVASQSNVAM